VDQPDLPADGGNRAVELMDMSFTDWLRYDYFYSNLRACLTEIDGYPDDWKEVIRVRLNSSQHIQWLMFLHSPEDS
jgi:hypothetical protein